MSQYYYGENPDLGDLIMGSEVIGVHRDFNFDGYNDLETITISGSAIKYYIVFLCDPVLNKFTYHEQLNSLKNLGIDEDKQQVISYAPWDCKPSDECSETAFYKWNGEYLEKIE